MRPEPMNPRTPRARPGQFSMPVGPDLKLAPNREILRLWELDR
jgi:hypothetical protein